MKASKVVEGVLFPDPHAARVRALPEAVRHRAPALASLDDLPRPEDLPILLRDRVPLEEVAEAVEEKEAPTPEDPS